MTAADVVFKAFDDDDYYGSGYSIRIFQATTFVDRPSYFAVVRNHEDDLIIKVRIVEDFFESGFTYADAAVSVLQELGRSWAIDRATAAGVNSLLDYIKSTEATEEL